MKSQFFVALVLLTANSVTFAGNINGKVAASSGHSIVYIDTIPGKTFPAPKDQPVMNQTSLQFSPHVMAIERGTTVEFRNNDSVQHNVFWPSIGGDKKAAKNMGTWPKGEERPFAFDKTGVVPLLCNVHPEMVAFIVVSPTPYFSETDDNGNYTIKDVPDGSYKLVVWHEGAKQQSKPVTVSGDTTADFTVSK